MNSPFARAIISLLAAYVLLLLFLVARDWIKEEYPSRPEAPANTERIQHHYYHQQALQAYARFKELPQSERQRIRASLDSGLIAMDEWIRTINALDYCVICLGESHKESTRTFLAEEFFSKARVDVLLLEAAPRELERIFKRLERGKDYFPLLEADILAVLRSARRANRNLQIHGIEETEHQNRNHRGESGARDQAIAANFWEKRQPGRRHLILFGALHCTNETNWLFNNLKSRASPSLRARMLNVCVLGEHQNGPLEAFIFFLDKLGIGKRQFVIPDTRALHPRIYHLFKPLRRQLLDKYSALVVFRE